MKSLESHSELTVIKDYSSRLTRTLCKLLIGNRSDQCVLIDNNISIIYMYVILVYVIF